MKSAALRLAVFLMFPGLLCGQSTTVTARVLLTSHVGGGKAVRAAGAVIWLTPAESSTGPLPRAPEHLRIVQHGKRFEPHLLVVPVGSTIEFPNHDPFFHNVFSLFDGKRFDLGLYEAGGSRTVHFDREGVSYIFCNIHSEMSAVIVSLSTPYYAVSPPTGEIAIPNVPPGRYVLRVWHEASSPGTLNNLTRQVVVPATSISLGTLQVVDDGHLLLGHKNLYGQDYETAPPASPMYPH